MASKDIKTTYDDNPTGCDDINSDYYFQVVKDDSGTLSDEGMSVPQMRAVLQDVGPPPVTDVFNMTIPYNTLNALLGPLFGDHTHWQLTNSATQPLYTDVSWSTWPMPTVFNVGSFSAQTWYLYTKDEFIVHTILNAQGTQGITITPVDTLAPVFPAGALESLTATSSTAIKFTAAPAVDPSPGTGLSGTYHLYFLSTDTPFLQNITIDSETEIEVGPGFNEELYIYTEDIAGNAGQSVDASFSTATTIDAGIINFNAVNYTSDEGDDIAPVLTRTTGSTGAVAVQVITVEIAPPDNAVAGTNFTGIGINSFGINSITWSGGNATVTTASAHGYGNTVTTGHGVRIENSDVSAYDGDWAIENASGSTFTFAVADNGTAGAAGTVVDGSVIWANSDAANKTLAIPTVDLTSTFNNQFQLHIVPGSGTNSVTIGTTDGALCNLTSTATGSGAWEEYDSGGVGLIVLDAGVPDTVTPGAGGATFNLNTWTNSNRVDSQKYVIATNNGLGTLGNDTSIDANAGTAQWSCNFLSSATYYVWLRMFTRTNSSQTEVHATYDNSLDTAFTPLDVGTTPGGEVNQWNWENTNGSTARSVSVTAGVQTFELRNYEDGAYVDKIVLTDTNAAGYDPRNEGTLSDSPYDTIDDSHGPLTYSVLGAASAGDNPNNLLVPTTPIPPDSIAPTALIPANSASDVVTSTVVDIVVSGMTPVSIQSFTVEIGGVPVSGAASILTDRFRFIPDGLAFSSTYSPVFVGTVRDSNNVIKSVATGAWSFTTRPEVPVTTDFLIDVSFDESNWDSWANSVDNTPSVNMTALGTGDVLDAAQPLQDLFHLWEDFPHINESRKNFVRDLNKAFIVPAPVGGGIGQGRCMKSTHFDNVSSPTGEGDKVGGVRFRCDLVDDGTSDWKTDVYVESTQDPHVGETTYPGYETIYVALDLYIPPFYTTAMAHKLFTVMTGYPLQSDHGAVTDPFYGVLGFLMMKHWYRSADGVAQVSGTSSTYYYDGQDVAQFDRWSKDGTQATQEDISTADAYVTPKGRWITEEFGCQMNTAPPPPGAPGGITHNQLWGSSALPPGCLADGWGKVWITDAALNQNGLLVQNLPHAWRRHNRLYINGFEWRDYMNNTTTNPTAPLTVEKPCYIKNVRASKTPITH